MNPEVDDQLFYQLFFWARPLVWHCNKVIVEKHGFSLHFFIFQTKKDFQNHGLCALIEV